MNSLLVMLALVGSQSLGAVAQDVEPTAITCQIERLDDARKFVGTDRLAIYLPSGLTNQGGLNAEVLDPAGLLQGGTFDSVMLQPVNNVFSLHGSGWPAPVLTVQPEKQFGVNAILGSVGFLAPDKKSDRNGTCRITRGSAARRVFEGWVGRSSSTERGK